LPEGQTSKFFVAVDTDGKGSNLEMQINGLLLVASRNSLLLQGQLNWLGGELTKF